MFIVYSKPNCKFCEQAKALLTVKNLPFKVVDLDVGQPTEEGKEYISRTDLIALIPTARTMPQIQVQTGNGTQLIGGYNELVSHIN